MHCKIRTFSNQAKDALSTLKIIILSNRNVLCWYSQSKNSDQQHLCTYIQNTRLSYLSLKYNSIALGIYYSALMKLSPQNKIQLLYF